MPNTNSADVKSLTKRKKEMQELYARRPEVELQIGKVLSFEITPIIELLKNRQRGSADYLFDETIVYLLREPDTDENFQEVLYVELNRRIWKLLKKFYQRFNNPADFEDFGQKIEMAILKKIFDINSDAADYAQVNFGDFVIKTAKVAWRGELVKIVREKEFFYTGREGDEDIGNQIENNLKSGAALADYTMMLKEGLSKLPPHIMLVAELLLDGWQIESKDESEPTISKKLDVTSRTIRNWLKEARAILTEYKGRGKKMNESNLEEVLEEYASATPEGNDLKALRSLADKYPQFADELTDFAAARAVVKHAPEEELSAEEEQNFAEAGIKNLRMVLGSLNSVGTPESALQSLVEEAKAKGLSRSKFAAAIGLSTSLVMYLEKRRLEFSSIPHTIVAKIARVLETGEDMISEYLNQPQDYATNTSFKTETRAENLPPKSFSEAIREDQTLSAAEKRNLLDLT